MRGSLAFAVGLALAASGASAATSHVTSRAALGGTDSIDWGQFGATFTSVANPSSGSTTNSMGFNVSKTLGGGFQRRDEGSGWTGNFSLGDRLLWVNNFGATSTNKLCIEFDSDVGAAGANIMSNYYGSFVAKIEAFDSGGGLLGSYTQAGTSGSVRDTAIFIGIMSDSCDIRKICFSLTSSPFSAIGDFAINQVDIGECGQVIPLPSAAGLALASMGLVAARRRRMA